MTAAPPRQSEYKVEETSDESCGKMNLQTFLQRYGLTAVLVYATISLMTFCSIYAALLWGMDASPVLERFGLSEVAADGTIMLVALACTKLLVPVKVPLAVFIVVQISRRRDARRRASDGTELRSLLDDGREADRECGLAPPRAEDRYVDPL